MDDNHLKHARNSHKTNVFRDWGVSSTPPIPSEDSPEPDDYTPYNLPQEEWGLAFYHDDGMITVKFYHHLQGMVCAPPYTMLTLMYLDCIYILEGRNLDQLIPRLRLHRIGELYCMDARRDAMLLEEPVIYHITEKSLAEVKAAFEE